jgi:lysophospholipase L1-like esterase
MVDQMTESRAPHRTRRVRPDLGSLLVLLLTTVLCVLAAEGVFRLFPATLPSEVHQRLARKRGIAHSYIGYLQTPNATGVIVGRDFQGTFHTDGHGFRNSWPWPDHADIVTLGDSVTFGYGVEDGEAWPALLAQAFPQLHVINLGLIGASPEQYVRVYETFGLPLRPKLVVVGFLASNDFLDNMLFHQWVQAGAHGNYLVWRDFDRHGPVKSFLLRHSYLIALLLQTRDVYQSWWGSEPRLLALGPTARVQLRPSVFRAWAQNATPENRGFQAVVRALARLHALTTAQGAQILIVLQPAKEQVYLPMLGEAVPDLSTPFRAALAAHGLPSIDLFPAFWHHAAAREALFFETDSHPNRQGYRLIAQEIAAYLTLHAAAYGLHESPEPPEGHGKGDTGTFGSK